MYLHHWPLVCRSYKCWDQQMEVRLGNVVVVVVVVVVVAVVFVVVVAVVLLLLLLVFLLLVLRVGNVVVYVFVVDADGCSDGGGCCWTCMELSNCWFDVVNETSLFCQIPSAIVGGPGQFLAKAGIPPIRYQGSTTSSSTQTLRGERRSPGAKWWWEELSWME